MGENEIRKYLLYLLDSGHSAGSVDVCNSVLRFISGAVLGRSLNCQLIHRRCEHRESPEFMSKKELAHFFSSMNSLRDRAMFETIYGVGLRLSEITYLRGQDIDDTDENLHPPRKGRQRSLHAALSA
jgi:site-specific recombinase XerD